MSSRPSPEAMARQVEHALVAQIGLAGRLQIRYHQEGIYHCYRLVVDGILFSRVDYATDVIGNLFVSLHTEQIRRNLPRIIREYPKVLPILNQRLGDFIMVESEYRFDTDEFWFACLPWNSQAFIERCQQWDDITFVETGVIELLIKEVKIIVPYRFFCERMSR